MILSLRVIVRVNYNHTCVKDKAATGTVSSDSNSTVW